MKRPLALLIFAALRRINNHMRRQSVALERIADSIAPLHPEPVPDAELGVFDTDDEALAVEEFREELRRNNYREPVQ